MQVSEEGCVNPRLLNNLGMISHLQSWFEKAQIMYENVLIGTSILGIEAETMSMFVLYNLVQVYEDLNNNAKVIEAYKKLLD
jgi:RNA polymerase-associated protein CTR9